jgi:hypothetical protein
LQRGAAESRALTEAGRFDALARCACKSSILRKENYREKDFPLKAPPAVPERSVCHTKETKAALKPIGKV